MSIAATKVAIDKLVKLYDPLRDAQQLLTDLETAEQRLREVESLTAGENNAVALLREERRKLEEDVKALRRSHDNTIKLTKEKAAELLARAKQDVQDIEAAGVAAKDAFLKECEAAETALALLRKNVEEKAAEQAALEEKIATQREAIRRFAEQL